MYFTPVDRYRQAVSPVTSGNSPFSCLVHHLLHSVGNTSCSFTSYPCSALDAGQRHLLVVEASSGAEAGRIPSYLGITSHCVRFTGLRVAEERTVNSKPAHTSTAGRYDATEILLHSPKVCRIGQSSNSFILLRSESVDRLSLSEWID